MIMIELLDKLIDEKQEQIAIVKMDIYTYENLIEKKDITNDLHDLELEASKNSKVFASVDDLFYDLEK